MSELVLHGGADLVDLAAAFTQTACLPGDPFVRPLLLLPEGGTERWLSQEVARRSGDEGIFAGFEIHRLAHLEQLLSPHPTDADPWAPERLVWTMLQLVDSDTNPRLQPLRHHLDANDQRYANALRIAHLLRRYPDHRPELIRRWSVPGAQESPTDDWQGVLWQLLQRHIAEPNPLIRRAALVSAIRQGEHAVCWPSIHVFAPRTIHPSSPELLQALASQTPVHIWLPTIGPGRASHPVGAPLGRRAHAWWRAWAAVAGRIEQLPSQPRPDTSLGALQTGIHRGETVTHDADHTITIQASHGVARQVGVLREAVAAAFADNPTLEPRDVAILCPDPDALAPHLHAAFSSPLDANQAHPATTLRVQVAERSAAVANQVYRLLADVLRLGARRATTNDLLALMSHPFVARRFGWSSEDLDRLEQLLDQASVRWGINRNHRGYFGLPQIAQNTWQLGVQRLLLGEALSADRPTQLGSVATVDDVSSTDTVRVGSLAEFVSRVSRIVTAIGEPGRLTTWVDRLRNCIDLLLDVPFDELWQLNQVWATLADWASRREEATALLGPSDAVALLDGSFAHRTLRPSYGNGSLVVSSLAGLARVPHRVLCLVGFDERTFPRRQRADGDDLLLREPHALDPDPGADDRQHFLDAILSASERLIVIYQGHSSHLNTEHHPPAGVLELIELLGSDQVRSEPLQPFAPGNFEPAAPRSFDQSSLAAARALIGPRRDRIDRWRVGIVPRTAGLVELELDSLVALVKHPGRFWLRQRTGITLGRDDIPRPELPLELDGLSRWKIGTQILTGLLAGHSVEALARSAWLSGDVPPLNLGERAMANMTSTAQQIHQAWQRVADGPLDSQLLSVDVGAVRVTGTVITRGGSIVEAHFGRIGPQHLGPAWMRVLVATAALGQRIDAVLVGPTSSESLHAPPVALARSFLADVVALAAEATEQVLLLPPRLSYRWAADRARGQDPLANFFGLKDDWKRDQDEVWHKLFPTGNPWEQRRTDAGRWGHPKETTSLGALAAQVWGPLITGLGR
ncbi:MAG: exodeoxyribonuclease V subunit gamma [Propioniciclava sp.]